MRTFIATITLLMLFCIASAQVDTKFSTSNFPGRANEVNTAKSNIKAGDELFYAGDFVGALKYYMPAQNFNPNNSDLNYIDKCIE